VYLFQIWSVDARPVSLPSQRIGTVNKHPLRFIMMERNRGSMMIFCCLVDPDRDWRFVVFVEPFQKTWGSSSRCARDKRRAGRCIGEMVPPPPCRTLTPGLMMMIAHRFSFLSLGLDPDPDSAELVCCPDHFCCTIVRRWMAPYSR
jgi:hypothetical protein